MRAALCSGSRQFCASNPRRLPLHLGSLVMRAALVLLGNSVPCTLFWFKKGMQYLLERKAICINCMPSLEVLLFSTSSFLKNIICSARPNPEFIVLFEAGNIDS
jgi:hypothetical protein